MNRTPIHEALIGLMTLTSASDRESVPIEIDRIRHIVATWPIFEDFDVKHVDAVVRTTRVRLAKGDGRAALPALCATIPQRFHDTAYAMAFEIASVDMEMRLPELGFLDTLRRALTLDAATRGAIERAAKARHRTLT